MWKSCNAFITGKHDHMNDIRFFLDLWYMTCDRTVLASIFEASTWRYMFNMWKYHSISRCIIKYHRNIFQNAIPEYLLKNIHVCILYVKREDKHQNHLFKKRRDGINHPTSCLWAMKRVRLHENMTLLFSGVGINHGHVRDDIERFMKDLESWPRCSQR